ncbi:MAG: M43 family zinc metalloprotease, partial [Bacteroidota bacterium]
MKKSFFFSGSMVATMLFILCSQKLSAANPPATDENKVVMRCGSMEAWEMQRQIDPEFDQRRKEFKDGIREYLQKNPNPKIQGVVTIPVVFHVVWRVAAENLSDACLKTQIDALNRDFRKLNTDISTAPAQFQAIAADCEFNFCLASKNPQGGSTNGITRKQTTVSTFSIYNEGVKHSSSGGDDTWGKANYLNIWICNLGMQVGGYVTQLGCAASNAIDGVVVNYLLTGQGSCANGNYDKGRSCVHETGHWFGLDEIFWDGCAGNTPSTCASQGDGICDTPPTANPNLNNYNCTPQNTCKETPTDQTDMIQNYMDYSAERCRVMFTKGQKAWMVATYNQCRQSVGSGATTRCQVGINDLSISDNISFYPNPSDGNIFMHVDLPNINSIDVTIYNAIGEAVLSKKIIVPSGREI